MSKINSLDEFVRENNKFRKGWFNEVKRRFLITHPDVVVNDDVLLIGMYEGYRMGFVHGEWSEFFNGDWHNLPVGNVFKQFDSTPKIGIEYQD